MKNDSQFSPKEPGDAVMASASVWVGLGLVLFELELKWKLLPLLVQWRVRVLSSRSGLQLMM